MIVIYKFWIRNVKFFKKTLTINENVIYIVLGFLIFNPWENGRWNLIVCVFLSVFSFIFFIHVLLYRNCIGQLFAVTQIKVVIPMLLRKFRFTLDPSRPAEPESMLILRSKNGLYLNIHPVKWRANFQQTFATWQTDHDCKNLC